MNIFVILLLVVYFVRGSNVTYCYFSICILQDEDMCSDKGCKALVQKMIHSRATSKEILEYVTERF